MKITHGLRALASVTLSFLAIGEGEARACGGCFGPVPPPGAPPQSVDSVITAERMIFSISKEQTTLYDEIKYSGSPSSFAWVLPIKGEVKVGLSADDMFAAIDSLTAATVAAPAKNCPPPPVCAVSYGGGGPGCGCGESATVALTGSLSIPGLPSTCSGSTFVVVSGEACGCSGEAYAICSGGTFSECSCSIPSGYVVFGGGSGGGSGGGPPPVTVTANRQVGPYEMVELHSNDGSALTSWLRSHGYRIPPADAAVVAKYVAEGMDFLALKLVPGEGVNAMQPVRVTTRGAFPVLPLRMVGVGTGPTTGITLWIVSDGRWEPQNAPSFTIQDSELAWDWASHRSNYEEVRKAKEAALLGAGWQIESSLELSEYRIENAVQAAVASDTSGVGGYLPAPSGADGGADAQDGAGGDAAPVEGGSPDAVTADDGGSDAALADGAVQDAPSPDATPAPDAVAEGGAPDAAVSEGAAPGDAADDADAGDGDAGDAGVEVGAGSSALAELDLQVMFTGLSGPNVRVTRLRGDIAHAALANDLVVHAATDQSEISNRYHTTSQVGQPLCPVYDSSCTQTGEAPRDQAEAKANGGCGTTPRGRGASQTALALFVTALGLGVARARRRRR